MIPLQALGFHYKKISSIFVPKPRLFAQLFAYIYTASNVFPFGCPVVTSIQYNQKSFFIVHQCYHSIPATQAGNLRVIFNASCLLPCHHQWVFKPCLLFPPASLAALYNFLPPCAALPSPDLLAFYLNCCARHCGDCWGHSPGGDPRSGGQMQQLRSSERSQVFDT